MLIAGRAEVSQRTVHGYRAVRYEIPRGCAAGYNARAERPLRDRRLQHAKRAAGHEAPRRRGDAGSLERSRPMTTFTFAECLVV
jgi:hypothetical protein